MREGMTWEVGLPWRIATIGGVLWGLAIAGLEISVEFGESTGALHFADAFLGLVITWCLNGLGWSFLIKTLDLRDNRFSLVAAWVAGSLAFTLAQIWVIFLPVASAFAEIRAFPPDAVFIHILWLNGFYGGLYVYGYTMFARALRSRRYVGRLQRQLGQEEAALSEARLRTMRNRVQPRILVEALAAAKALYGRNPAHADELVDLLINFLRTVSAVSSADRPTLNGELGLAVAYIRLQAKIQASNGKWGASVSSMGPNVPFPPGLLLPLIEEMGRAADRVELQAGRHASVFRIQVIARMHDAPGLPVCRVPPLLEKQGLEISGASLWSFATSRTEQELTWTATREMFSETISPEPRLERIGP